MSDMHASTLERWTWADLVSSYRFWAITIYFAAIAGSATLLTSHFPVLIRHWAQLPYSELGQIVAAQPIGMVLGVPLAWAISRSKGVGSLHWFSVIFVIGVALTCLSGAALPLIALGYFLVGLTLGATALILPALIAQATSRVETYILAFGLFTLLKTLCGGMLVPAFGAATDWLSSSPYFLLALVAVPVIIGALLLLSLNGRLFEEAPPLRQIAPHRETPHNPLLTFLLTLFVPFYVLFWLVRIHRDIRSYSQSPSLLTPRGAGWMCFFVPFAFPMALSAMSDILRDLLQQRGQPARVATGLMILTSLLFPPLGAALIQAQMNRLIAQG